MFASSRNESVRKPSGIVKTYALTRGRHDQLAQISNIDVLLLLIIRAGRSTVIRPSLELQKEQHDERKDG